ncbi:MAG: PDC sensor domain-containing protein [Bacillota bacterium]
MVYTNVADQLKKHMAQRLLWQTNFCHQQLKEVFLRAALKLDSLSHSSAARAKDLSRLRQEMDTIRDNFPSMIRIWLAYRDGKLITSFDYPPGPRPASSLVARLSPRENSQ